MDPTVIAKQLEFYSNATTGFLIIQSITFCYEVARSHVFKNALKEHKKLAKGLKYFVVINGIGGSCVIGLLGYWLWKELNFEPYAECQSLTYGVPIIIICLIKVYAVLLFSGFQLCVIQANIKEKEREEEAQKSDFTFSTIDI